jgi:hypothetical protein
MKILFVSTMLGVKQFHLASALTEKYGFECHFAHTFTNGLNWKLGLSKFPKIKKMISHTINSRNFHSKDDYEIFKNSSFDWIYCNTLIDEIPNFSNIWLDIEDLSYYTSINPEKRNLSKIQIEQKAIDKAKIITFGSKGEKKKAEYIYYFQDTEPLLMYPYVAKRTIPKIFKKKDKDFSLVYAGSSYPGGYRDFFSVFEEILENIDYNFTIYLTSWRNYSSWNKIQKLAKKYPNLIIKKSLSFTWIKYAISNFHVGLTVFRPEYRKPQLTFGMKPLEYAYANVQPVSIGSKLIGNNNKEFGYQSNPQTIKEDYVNNLANFDKEKNLMDNNMKKIVGLMETKF